MTATYTRHSRTLSARSTHHWTELDSLAAGPRLLLTRLRVLVTQTPPRVDAALGMSGRWTDVYGDRWW